MSKTVNFVKLTITYTAVILARLGLINEARGKRIANLAWPRVATGLARKSKTTADLAMIGLAVGPAAIAGVGFAFAFWGVANSIGWSFASGAMAFFSQRIGADDQAGLDLVVKQTLWILGVTASIFTGLFIAFAEQLITLLGASPEAVTYGTIYLKVAALALIFNAISHIAERVLVSANDAWSPMVVRVTGAVANILLNAFFIFGLGLGVFGAALGTALASGSIAIILLIGLINGRLPLIGSLPVQISVGPPFFEGELMKEILEVGAPVAGKQVASRGANFAMLAIIAYFGTIFVAAYTVAREIRRLMNTPAWGINTAARSLVGQELGNDDEQEAEAYGWDILRFTMAVYALMSVLMFVFAEQIAPLFTNDPSAVAAAVPFIKIMAVSLIGLGIDSAASGVLGAAGDTRWPLYARFAGLYVFMIPIAYLGLLTPIGIVALYVAVTAETVIPALITYFRFTTSKWKIVSRRFRPSSTD